MTGIPDELVEKAARAMFDEGANISPMWTIPMRAALEAIGLPALLERVEAATVARTEFVAMVAERDALAAKVALTELERAALTHAIEVYTGPDDDTIPVLRSMLTRAVDEPTHEQQVEAFGEMG